MISNDYNNAIGQKFYPEISVESKVNLAWYAILVRSRHEKKVAVALQAKRIEISLPLMKLTRQWSDRRKVVQVLLFRGYVFVRVDLKLQHLDVLETFGVVRFAGIGGNIIPIPDRQMYWLRTVLAKSDDFDLVYDFPIGKRVRVSHGPWLGLEGVVQDERLKNRLVIWIDTLIQGLAVNIDSSLLQPLI